MDFQLTPITIADTAWRADWRTADKRQTPVCQTASCSDQRGTHAKIRIEQYPDDTIALSQLDVCEKSATASINTGKPCPDVAHHLLQQTMDVCQSIGGRYVRYVTSEGDAPGIPDAVASVGFRRRGTVRQWLRSGHLPLVPSPFHFTTAKTSNMDHVADGIHSLLINTLTCSEDLPNVPASSPAQLMALWRYAKADFRIIIASDDNRPVGLLVCSQQQEAASEEPIVIEYLGVRSDCRRIGVATDLIQQIPAMLSSDTPSGYFAFAATDNHAATAFYIARQFQSGPTMDVWTFKLN